MKRAFDIGTSFLFLLLFSPLFVLISLLIFLEDFGSVFYLQYRVGHNGRKFTIYKFRTMSNKIFVKNIIDIQNYSRITRIGKILRKSKLDELPQLFNVLKGDMSIVGPRPEVPQFVSEYPERWAVVHRVKPGLTDYASIEFRNEEDILRKSANPNEIYIHDILPKKLSYYEYYERNHSFGGDLKIILKTIYVIFFK